MESMKNPPPGQMMTAVPIALSGSGENTFNVGFTTLKTNSTLPWPFVLVCSLRSQVSEPGATPSYKLISLSAAQPILVEQVRTAPSVINNKIFILVLLRFGENDDSQ